MCDILSVAPLGLADVIMEDGLLSLKWNNHKTTFFDILRVLREKVMYERGKASPFLLMFCG